MILTLVLFIVGSLAGHAVMTRSIRRRDALAAGEVKRIDPASKLLPSDCTVEEKLLHSFMRYEITTEEFENKIGFLVDEAIRAQGMIQTDEGERWRDIWAPITRRAVIGGQREDDWLLSPSGRPLPPDRLKTTTRHPLLQQGGGYILLVKPIEDAFREITRAFAQVMAVPSHYMGKPKAIRPPTKWHERWPTEVHHVGMLPPGREHDDDVAYAKDVFSRKLDTLVAAHIIISHMVRVTPILDSGAKGARWRLTLNAIGPDKHVYTYGLNFIPSANARQGVTLDGRADIRRLAAEAAKDMAGQVKLRSLKRATGGLHSRATGKLPNLVEAPGGSNHDVSPFPMPAMDYRDGTAYLPLPTGDSPPE